MTSSQEYLVAALRGMREEKSKLDHAIAAVEGALAAISGPPAPQPALAASGLSSTPSAKPVHERVWGGGGSKPSRAAKARELIESEPNTVWSAPILAKRLEDGVPDEKVLNAYSAVLSRLKRAGVIEPAPGRGEYHVVTQPGPHLDQSASADGGDASQTPAENTPDNDLAEVN